MFWCPVFLFSGTCPISSGMKYIALACCVIKNFIRAEPLARDNLFSEDALLFYDSNGVEGASYIIRP